jgi:hypothetical protein
VGIEAFVEGLGLPLTWSMAVLDMLLLLFSMFLLQTKSSLNFVGYFFALVMRFLYTCYALFCTVYAFLMHILFTFYALFMRP